MSFAIYKRASRNDLYEALQRLDAVGPCLTTGHGREFIAICLVCLKHTFCEKCAGCPCR